jgi:2-keto-3-deoxy-L-arabinonate dehydratase
MARTVYSGVFPIAPTIFDDSGDLDLEGNKRALDFMIDAGVNGICILANYSEQFSLTDAERERLTDLSMAHVGDRVPVIVTTSHFSTRIAAERGRRAQAAGARMVMLMPPYHGATLRVDEAGIRAFFSEVAGVCDLPIMIQDAPISGTTLSAPFLAQLAREIPTIRYLKVEVAGAAAKLRELIRLAGPIIDGPFDGEESITLIPDLDAGATGTMPSAAYPDLLRPIVDAYLAGDRQEASDRYERLLPLINYENRQCGLRATKILMKEGGVIASEATRHPIGPVGAATRAELIDLARRRDPLVLRWGR